MRHTDFRFALDPELGVELLASAGDAADYPWHSHVSSCVLGLVRRGAMALSRRCKTRETRQILRAGEVFILGPHEAHRLSAARPYALLNLCVDAQILATPGATQIIAARLSALCREGWLHVSECAALTAALGCVARIGAIAPAGNNALDELRAFLETCPEESISLNDLAKWARLDKFQLIRQFRARYGLTPHRFQMQNRLRRARRACLAATSLTDLALTAGFYDQSHFIREFRKATGVTPSQYRRAGHILPSIPFPDQSSTRRQSVDSTCSTASEADKVIG
ncbi:MAG: AraC family transcriptional regulator [Betaproteobacteria bacterium]|nr:AraC family transcriptional regulator [Betaproteobacteria bacterium]MCL2887056.1 AraC family transcriptional regulator [Betaproteobacteria bacterium]